jgi:hypothetical protein
LPERNADAWLGRSLALPKGGFAAADFYIAPAGRGRRAARVKENTSS